MTDVIYEPRWLTELKKQCNDKSQVKVANETGYSTAVISRVLNGKYGGPHGGDIDSVASTVYQLYLGDLVLCPAMGEIQKKRCIQYQKETFSATNPISVKRYIACRSGCTNSEIEE